MKKTILICLSILFLACSEDNPIQYEEPIKFFPTEIGNEWHYHDFFNDIVISYKTKILKDSIMFDNERWSIQLFPGGMACIINNRADGLYFINEFGQPVLRYKYPAKANEFFLDDKNDTIKVLATNVEVSVEAGTFKCYRYLEKNEKNEEIETFLSPGVGMVKTLMFTPDDGTINSRQLYSNTELQSYNFKK